MAIADENRMLPPELEKEMETIAAAVHDSWIQQRQSEGWNYAEAYSYDQKDTPFMVAYDALPESEKEMDRVTVRQVICTLIRLGYRIER